jgi:hypothetical protein
MSARPTFALAIVWGEIHLGVASPCWWRASLAAGPTFRAWAVAC